MLYSKDLLETDSSSFSAKKEKSFKNTDGISEQDSDDRTKRYREEFISLSIHKCASKTARETSAQIISDRIEYCNPTTM
ncbi:hypothetical protein [Leptospira santarosai]|uniref:hypothetical protein n=1 Tax=Leptospira santarosai TaxID=28183 RepID=UPI0002BFBFB0|nr:hypothetical protein [Leptospira santarosai]EMO70880.1 hypothetical protein LEP1GSC130_1491 [Leptospira santarosai str. 200403458]EMP00117.1 hypothetical protein LEP1GSC120_2687 [Leptospira santarosai str. 200702252]